MSALHQLAANHPEFTLKFAFGLLVTFTIFFFQVTASHQLATATQTLSLCVRPMLIAGLQVDGDGEGESCAY